MSSQLFPSHDNRLIASLSSTRDKHRARQIRRTRDKTIFGVPLELRIPRVFLARVYFSCLITLAEIRGYSPCWTVTLLLAFLAVTITFYFNKFKILRAYELLSSDCTMPDPGRMHKKLSKITWKCIALLMQEHQAPSRGNLWKYEYFAAISFLYNCWLNSVN